MEIYVCIDAVREIKKYEVQRVGSICFIEIVGVVEAENEKMFKKN